MHRSFYLAKVLRQSGSGGDGTEKGRSSTNTVWLIIGIIIAIGLVALGIFSGRFSIMLGDPIAFTKSLFFIGAVLGIILSLPGFINNLYMANDLQVLLTLPYKPTEITAAKIINSVDMLIGCILITTLPFQITYGIVWHMGVGYYIAVLCAVICIPIIAISFVSIVIMLIMYFVNGLKNKDTLKIIGGILLFVIVVLVVILLNNGNVTEERVSAILTVVGRISNILPINFALESLITEMNILSIILIILITAAFLVLFLLCAAKLYIPGALSVQETAANGRALSDSQFGKECRQKSVFKAYFTEDLRHVRRDPAYLMTGWLYPIFYPAVMLIIYVFAISGMEFMKLSSLTDTTSAIGWCTGVSLLITFVSASTSSISNSCMSREGEAIMILKQTPVAYKTVLRAKMYVAMITCALGSTTYIVIGGIILAIMGYIPAWAIIYCLILNICCLYFIICMGMMHDIKSPAFTWETEAGMVKKCAGASSVVLLVLGILIPMAIIPLTRFLASNYWIVMIVMVVICAVLAFIETRRLFGAGVKKMMKY